MYHVYKITNKINNKIYVGRSKDALKRFRIHLKIANGGKEKYPRKFFAIHAALAKYGIENFSFEIIHNFQTEMESINSEQKYIHSMLENKIPTYNINEGDTRLSGWHHTEESKKKMSKVRKGRKFSAEHKLALSEAQKGEKSFMYGTHLTPEWKQKKNKLTIQNVKEIKILIKKKVKLTSIALKYNVSIATVSMIKNQRIWQDITI